MKWDLSDLYMGTSDPKIQLHRAEIEKRVSLFNKKYKGTVNKNISEEKLLKYLSEIERIDELVANLSSYARLLHSTDQNNHKIGLLHSSLSEFANKISTQLKWFSVSLKKLPRAHLVRLSKNKKLESYSHYLKKLVKSAPFTLSEREEILNTKKNLTGNSAFVNFFDKIVTNERFELGKKKLTLSEIANISSYDKKREIRKQARITISERFKKQNIYYTFILNNLLLDRKMEDEIRGFKYPQESTFVSYEVERPTVDMVVEEIQNAYPLCDRYYKVKKQILGFPALYDWDRYCEIYPKAGKKYSWEETKNIVVEAFSEVDNIFCETAKLFFKNNWIDAKIAPHKRYGAYCSYITPSKHPYIFMNFKGKQSDIMTLAHELGHGIHAYLSRKNSLYNYYPSTATAEIASIFAESLVFDYIYKNTSDRKFKINMLANKIESSFATVFRQTAFYLFELDINIHRRSKGELSTEEFDNFYQKRLQEMFGKSLTLSEHHKNNWMPVLHFYHYNFYVFTYAMGELLTNSLYQKYKTNGGGFVKKYISALKTGGSKNPYEITKMMGVDMKKAQTWREGFKLLAGWVDEFEKLVTAEK